MDQQYEEDKKIWTFYTVILTHNLAVSFVADFSCTFVVIKTVIGMQLEKEVNRNPLVLACCLNDDKK